MVGWGVYAFFKSWVLAPVILPRRFRQDANFFGVKTVVSEGKLWG